MRLRVVVPAALLGVALLAVIAFLLGRIVGAGPAATPGVASSPPSAAAAPTAPSLGTDDPGTPSDESAVGSPQQAAVSWLRAFRGVGWTDARPDAWVERTQPFVTQVLDGAYRQPALTGPGAQWQLFVARRCVSRVVDVSAVVPDEAPRTPSSAYAQVAGTVVTTCDGGDPPGPDREPASATVETHRLPDGTWRVNQRLY